MKNFTLDVEYDYDFKVFGLVSSSKEYKLAWNISRFLSLRLKLQPDLVYDFINKGRLVISHYLYQTEHSTFRLLRNKSWVLGTLKKPFLLPEIKDYDYIVQISGALADEYLELVQEKLRTLETVQYIKEFDPESFRYKDNLLIET